MRKKTTNFNTQSPVDAGDELIINFAQEPEKEEVVVQKDVEGIAQDPAHFQMLVREAQRKGRSYVQVSEKLFKHMVNKDDVSAFTYGNPGVVVIKEGKIGEFEESQTISAEALHNKR